MASADLNAQQLSTYQSIQQQLPVTIASTGGVIAPTTRLSFVSGTANVVTITPPTTGYSEIVLIFTASTPGQFTTAGNIKATLTTITQNAPVLLFYNPAEAKWYFK
jgi:hypothetical protein